MKQIRFSGHARETMGYRGATELEVIDAMQTMKWQQAAGGRWECRKDIPYGKEWNDKFYATKQIRPIFAEEPNEIVVVTVYVYYF